jgi:predicted metal-dependent peptidase
LLDIYYYACDFAINWIIKETFHNTGLTNCYPTRKNIPFPLDNKKYYGLSAEEIFEDLIKHIKTGNFEFVPADSHSNNLSSNNKNSTKPSANNQLIKIDNNIYQTFDEHRNFNSGNTQEDHAKEVEFKSALQNAFQSLQSRGDISKNLQILYNKLFLGSINWVDVLSSYIHRSLAIVSGKVDYTWDRPNRRLIHTGVYLPSMISRQINVCIGLDISGSMLQVLDLAIPEILGLINQYSTNAYLISCDCEVKNVQQVSSIHQLDLQSFLVGGGGTNITPIFEYIEEELGGKCDLVIIVTDGYIDEVDARFSEYETIWLIINNPDFKPKFGNTIYLDKNGKYVFV